METKGLTCKIPLELHQRISEEIAATGSTLSRFITEIIHEHYEGGPDMAKTRTMAFQISEELFQQIKTYLTRYEAIYGRRLTQREFVLTLIQEALAEAEDDFAAMEAAAQAEAENEPAEETSAEDSFAEAPEQQPEETE